jgi:two-component system, OmpR family, sensor histidine kinase KdpD
LARGSKSGSPAGWDCRDSHGDGPGVDPDQQERIFELFARAKATSRLPGAGIGLFVVRRLVEAMGGRVTVANRPEGGAAFTVTLPRYVEPAES